MKKPRRKVTDNSAQQIPRLLAVLVASALGTISTTAFLDWRVATLQAGAWQVRLALTVAATMIYALVYALVVWVSFYMLTPDHRPALKRIFPWFNE